MSSNRIITLIVILVLLVCGYWVSQNFRIVETEVSTGYDGEARTNSYYAARQFLRRMGYDARTLSTLDLHNQAYGENSTLLYFGNRQNLGEQRSQQLLDWVERGGHLLLTPQSTLEVDDSREDTALDPILNELEIYAYYSEYEEEELDQQESDVWDADEELDLSELVIDGYPTNTFLYSAEQLVGTLPGDQTASDQYGIQWLSRGIGRGHVSIMTDFTPFQNYQLEQHQNAQLLRLVTGMHAREGDIIWLLHDTDMPPLWRLILNSALPVVVSCFAILMVWLWGSLFRFGPIVREPEPEQRQLLEHLDAAGNHQRKHAPTKLFSITQSALHKKIARLYPQWSTLEYQEKTELLLDQLNLTESGAKLVLSKPSQMMPNEFYAAIRTLQSIRKSI